MMLEITIFFLSFILFSSSFHLFLYFLVIFTLYIICKCFFVPQIFKPAKFTIFKAKEKKFNIYLPEYIFTLLLSDNSCLLLLLLLLSSTLLLTASLFSFHFHPAPIILIHLSFELLLYA